MSTTSRHVRIDDELWSAVLAEAKAQDRNVAELIRELLEQWVK